MKKKSTKTCKICNAPFTGRADKVFCSYDCKNVYHYGLRQTVSLNGSIINGFLARNYELLHELLDNRKTQLKIDRKILERKKFRFKYHTHIFVNKKGNTYHYVYDLAWMEFMNNQVLIVKKTKTQRR